MSRQLKFRAWDKESQKIYYVVTLDTESVYGKCEVPIIRVKTGKMLDEYQPEYKTVYDYTLMQYTGLKDRNGVEIYEGDIVSNGERVRYLTGQERRWWCEKSGIESCKRGRWNHAKVGGDRWAGRDI